MKTRMGFVSNSSTSSFLIYGVQLVGDSDGKNLAWGILRFQKERPEEWKELIAGLRSTDDKSEYCVKRDSGIADELEGWEQKLLKNNDYSIEDDIGEWLGLFGLECHYCYDETFVGLSWDAITDDETGKQFKDNVRSLIKIFLGEEYSKGCGTHQEAWQNG